MDPASDQDCLRLETGRWAELAERVGRNNQRALRRHGGTKHPAQYAIAIAPYVLAVSQVGWATLFCPPIIVWLISGSGQLGVGQNGSSNAQQVGQSDAPPVGGFEVRFFIRVRWLRLSPYAGQYESGVIIKKVDNNFWEFSFDGYFLSTHHEYEWNLDLWSKIFIAIKPLMSVLFQADVVYKKENQFND